MAEGEGEGAACLAAVPDWAYHKDQVGLLCKAMHKPRLTDRGLYFLGMCVR